MRASAALLGLLAASGCGASEPTERASATPPAESAPVPTAAESHRSLAAYPEAWNPSTPVDLSGLATSQRYVTSASSALCPTREEAERRACGNSIEFPELGELLHRGDVVTVVGGAPFDAHWRAIRYQVGGTLPGWIRADDLGSEPDRSEWVSFSRRADVAGARPIDGLDVAAIRALPAGSLVRYTLRRGIRYAVPGPEGEPDLSGSFVLYVPVGPDYVAIELLEVASDEDENAEWPWAEHHPCLLQDGCLTLAYACAEGGYCDEVSILAMATGAVTPPPAAEEDDDDEWPTRPQTPTPLLVGLALADRFGTFTFRSPAVEASGD